MEIDKTISLEVYKQEMENLRFFEDLFFKLHFFTLSGLSVIAAYLLERKILISLTVLLPLILITIIILIIVYETDRKHISRMRRLVKIQDSIGLGGVYGAYKNNITNRAVVFLFFYSILLLLLLSSFLYKAILLIIVCN